MMYKQRRQARMKNFSYSMPGTYHIVICTYDLIPFLGEIKNDEMSCSALGIAADQAWRDIATLYYNVSLDEFIIMPTHIHGIVTIEGAGAYKANETSSLTSVIDDINEASPKLLSMIDIIRNFKSYTTHIHYEVKKQPLWQRGYYEHKIRSKHELEQTREYIRDNIINWKYDEYGNIKQNNHTVE